MIRRTTVSSNEKELRRIEKIVCANRLLLGRQMAHKVAQLPDKVDLIETEFQVHSQWGDDGIIQYLINKVDLPNKTFIEFGVETFEEANSRFLLENNNWSGLIMDGSTKNMEHVRRQNYYWQRDLVARDVFITKENINGLIEDRGFGKEVGILHIDIDGNDYWIWKEVNVINPIIVIVEYNSVFGPDNHWTIPYQADFFRGNAHHSNLYYGVSVPALCDLAEEKGYDFVGCNDAGNNAYFVRKDKSDRLKKYTAAEGYVESKFSESRDENGQLTYARGKDRLKIIQGLPIVDTKTGERGII